MFGLDTKCPDNLRYIEAGKALYVAGNALVVLEIATMKRRLIFGLGGRGVGCFAIHPSHTLIALGEKGVMPNVYIYEYPSFKVAKVSLQSSFCQLHCPSPSVGGPGLPRVGLQERSLLTCCAMTCVQIPPMNRRSDDTFSLLFSCRVGGKVAHSIVAKLKTHSGRCHVPRVRSYCVCIHEPSGEMYIHRRYKKRAHSSVLRTCSPIERLR